MATHVQVIFYSMYGHRMAEAVVAGAREVAGVEVTLLQVPELVPEEILEKSGAKAAREALAHVPLARVEQLPDADAVIFGTPTRFGNMAAQMRHHLLSQLSYVSGDYNDPATFTAIKTALRSARGPAHYLAIPPSLFETVMKGLDAANLAAHARVIIEKPFGRDLASACELNHVAQKVFPQARFSASITSSGRKRS